MGQKPIKTRRSVHVFKQVKANIVVIGVRKSGDDDVFAVISLSKNSGISDCKNDHSILLRKRLTGSFIDDTLPRPNSLHAPGCAYPLFMVHKKFKAADQLYLELRMSSIMDKVIPSTICDSSSTGNASATLTPCKGVNLITWGIGFGNHRPPLWKYHVKNADGLILIVDSGNQRTLVTMKNEMNEILDEKVVTARELPVIVLANKSDLTSARSAADIADALKLYEHSITWNVQCCSAVTGEGLMDGFRKLMELIRMRKLVPDKPSPTKEQHIGSATL